MDDSISRQVAIDAIYHHFPDMTREECAMVLHEVPSAPPEQFNPCTVCQEFDCTGCKFRRTNA